MEMTLAKPTLATTSYAHKSLTKFPTRQMKQTNGLKFAEILREERRNNLTQLKELNWDYYERIRVVGKGAFGTATLYRKKPEGCLVVLKAINMNDLKGSERQLAINEIKVLSILHHPNIISYYDSFQCNGELLIEMEYADAGTLGDFLSQLTTPLQEHEILLVFRQIVSAISHLHDNNILHRDIKTVNIFLNKEGFIKVGDFGISKMLTTLKKEAVTVVGTPHYISPEICEGKSYNEKSDIWALGCVLYEMACLKKTFDGSNLPALVNKIVKGQFTPIKQNFTQEFRNLISNLLQRNADMRPTAKEVKRDVINLLNKLHLDRYHIWNKNHHELTTANDMYLGLQKDEDADCLEYPRSIVYEVKHNQPHIGLERIELPKKKRIKELSKSYTHFLALTYDSLVYAWGHCENGQLGLGTQVRDVITKPTLVTAVRNRKIVRVCAGVGFSVFISKNGLVLTCGDSASGCLGRSDRSTSFIPKLVDALLSVDVANISCGPNHVVVVSGNGKAYSWGCNVDGRLGVGQDDIASIDTPTQVEIDEDVSIKNVFCGVDATAFIDDKNCVWMCGNNEHNKLGLNEKHQFRVTKVEYKSVPTKLKWLKKRVLNVSLGKTHTAFLMEGGKVITIGSNCDGQLGVKHVRNEAKPQHVTQLGHERIIKIQVGSCFTLASNYHNNIHFWGARIIPNQCRSSSLQSNRSSECNDESSLEQIQELSSTIPSDGIKIGICNYSLVQMVEIVGPDFPIVQLRDPQVIIDNINDFPLLISKDDSSSRDVILKPQAIVSLCASPVHLHQGEIIGLANFYCFNDDSIYIIIDTTIPMNISSDEEKDLLSVKMNHDLSDNDNGSPITNYRKFSLSQSCFLNNESTISENIPDWIRREMVETNDSSLFIPDNQMMVPGMRKADSLPAIFDVHSEDMLGSSHEHYRDEIAKLNIELKRVNDLNQMLVIEKEELKEEINRFKRKESSKKRYKLCDKCLIQ